MPHAKCRAPFLIEVMLAGDHNICMTQRMAGRVDPVLGTYLAAKLFPQRVERLVAGDTVVAEPYRQRFERSLASIVRVRYTKSRRDFRFDHEVTRGSRAESSKDFVYDMMEFYRNTLRNYSV